MKELVEYMARSIVDDPDEVYVEEEQHAYRVNLHLFVAEDDMGKVIGKGGRVAQAMRQLLKVAAARRDVRANLEIG